MVLCSNSPQQRECCCLWDQARTLERFYGSLLELTHNNELFVSIKREPVVALLVLEWYLQTTKTCCVCVSIKREPVVALLVLEWYLHNTQTSCCLWDQTRTSGSALGSWMTLTQQQLWCWFCVLLRNQTRDQWCALGFLNDFLTKHTNTYTTGFILRLKREPVERIWFLNELKTNPTKRTFVCKVRGGYIKKKHTAGMMGGVFWCVWSGPPPLAHLIYGMIIS